MCAGECRGHPGESGGFPDGSQTNVKDLGGLTLVLQLPSAAGPWQSARLASSLCPGLGAPAETEAARREMRKSASARASRWLIGSYGVKASSPEMLSGPDAALGPTAVNPE